MDNHISQGVSPHDPPTQQANTAFATLDSAIQNTSVESATELLKRAEKDALSSVCKVIGITTEIFGPNVSVKEDYDPEESDLKYVVLSVEVDDVESGLQKERQWVSRVRSVSAIWNSFRLSLSIRA
jgi:hypothetical protein